MKSVNALLCLLLVTCLPLSACELVVRFGHYPPQSSLDENQQWQGMTVEQTKALLKQADCRYKFVETPWARALDMLAKGQIDMMSSVTITPERQQFAHFIGPQRQEHMVLTSLASSPITLEKLYQLKTRGKPIAILQGAFYGDKFSQLVARDQQTHGKNKEKGPSHFLRLPNNRVKLSLLQKGRVSAIVEEKSHVLYQLRNNPTLSNVAIYPVTIYTNPVHIALSKTSIDAALLARLQQAFATLKANQTFGNIHHKFAGYDN